MDSMIRAMAKSCGASMSSSDYAPPQSMVLFRDEQLAEYTKRVAQECADLCRQEAERLYAMTLQDHSALALKAEDLQMQIMRKFGCS